jgi:quercetin dioxygenase-like cupin family protein
MSTSGKSAGVVRTGEGTAVHWGPAGTIRILAGAATTDGSFSVVEALEEPGSAAPLHVHHGEAEALYVVEGEIELTCGDETLTASAGDFVYTPRDVPHKYAVVGERAARVLLLFSRPGFESFFAEAGTPLDAPPAGPPDPAELQRLVARYDLELLETFGH